MPYGTLNMTQSDVVITPCGDGSYCCGQNNTSCCNNEEGYWIINSEVYAYNQKPSSTTSAPTSGCYRPGGSSVGTDYQPCNSGGASMCCATNRVGVDKNTCRPDNLCYDLTTQLIWRESCTDVTWKDPACLELCVIGNSMFIYLFT